MYVLIRINLENVMLSEKQVVDYEKYIIYVKQTNMENNTTFLQINMQYTHVTMDRQANLGSVVASGKEEKVMKVGRGSSGVSALSVMFVREKQQHVVVLYSFLKCLKYFLKTFKENLTLMGNDGQRVVAR